MTNLINIIVSLILADLYYGRVTGIENLHIQRSAVPFMKRPEGSLAASSLNRFPNVHPNIGSSPNIPSLNGIGSIKNGPASPFSQSLRSASLDQPNTLSQNMPGLAPTIQQPQIHASPIQPSPSLNSPITDQKQDITRAFPLQQAQSGEPSVGPEDNVESTAHEQPMAGQSQALQQSPGSSDSTDQNSGSDISSQPQSSMHMLDLPPLETMAEVPAKSLTTSAAKSSDFEEGPLDENTLRSINLEVTKAEPIPNSLVGSDIFNAQDQPSENAIPLTQAVNQQPESPAPLNDPKPQQPNISLSQAVEPAARAINQPVTPIAPAPAPIPITPAQAPAPAPPALPVQPQSPPQQINMLPQQPLTQQQIAAPGPQPQPNAMINPNEKMQAINPNNLLNQPPTTVNPPSNPNPPPTSIQPNGQSSQHTPSPIQAPPQSPSPPPPPPATPSPAPSNNPEQTPNPPPQTQEIQTPSPTSSQDAQSTNAPAPSPTPDSSSSDSAKPSSSSSSSTSYVFKSVKPINTLMDSNARPITSCSATLLVSLLLVSVGSALLN